jgi:hypothetical protein
LPSIVTLICAGFRPALAPATTDAADSATCRTFCAPAPPPPRIVMTTEAEGSTLPEVMFRALVASIITLAVATSGNSPMTCEQLISLARV